MKLIFPEFKKSLIFYLVTYLLSNLSGYLNGQGAILMWNNIQFTESRYTKSFSSYEHLFISCRFPKM